MPVVERRATDPGALGSSRSAQQTGKRRIGVAGRCDRGGSDSGESSDGAPKICARLPPRMVPVPKQIYVFEAELVDLTVRRTIATRSSQTLDDLHHTLRAAFGWDDEHLYSFWLKG